MKSSLNRTVDVISGLIQKHVIINNKVKQNTLNQQNYSELNNKLNNLQSLIGKSNISTKFYKCISADTAAKKWSGYELALQDGVYVVSDTVTDGLTYTGFTPVVGTVYNEDTTLTIGTLFSKSETLEGCVFAANMQVAEATYNGEVVPLEGITLADAPGYTDGTKALSSDINLPFDGVNIFADGNSTVAFSAYFITKADGSPTFVKMCNGEGYEYIESYQQYSAGKMYSTIQARVSNAFNSGFYDCGSFGWHHIVLQNKGNEFGKFFVDGVLIATDTSTSGYDAISQIKSIISLATTLRGACMKDLQIYNRILSEEEITTLYEKAKLPTA